MKNRESGLAAVEFALVVPLLLLLLFGIINYGILLYDKAVITNAAREGARWASINASSSTCSNTANMNDPCGVAINYMANNLITFGTVTKNVTYGESSCSGSAYSAGCLETVIVNYTFTGIGYLWASMIGSAGTLSAISVMYHE